MFSKAHTIYITSNSHTYNIKISSHNVGGQSDFDGLLGMNFLSNYRFEIDSSANTLNLKPKE